MYMIISMTIYNVCIIIDFKTINIQPCISCVCNFCTYNIPSIPELISTTSSPGQVTLEVRTRSPGDNTSFQFNVTIINISDKSIVENESYSFMKYISNTIVPLTNVLTNGGSFSFNITTTNKYGSSKVTMTTGEITIN